MRKKIIHAAKAEAELIRVKKIVRAEKKKVKKFKGDKLARANMKLAIKTLEAGVEAIEKLRATAEMMEVSREVSARPC